MPNINKIGTEIISHARKGADKVSEKVIEKSGARVLSPSNLRELEMVPKYLELAVGKDGNYRFNEAQIKELTQLCKGCRSKFPLTDMIKELLSVGTKKGEALSFDEMKSFLKSTQNIDEVGQKRIIDFMRRLKEKDVKVYDASYVAKNSSFEEFKADTQKCCEWTRNYDDKQWRELYRNTVKHEMELASNAWYSSLRSEKPSDICKYINPANKTFVEGLAKCKEPTVIADLVAKTGITPEVTLAANELGRIYVMSDGNMDLLLDLVNVFYSSEIKQIAGALAKKKTLRISSYTTNVDLTDRMKDLSSMRRNALRELGLLGEIKLLPLGKLERIPQYKFYPGSFEQGKRR